MTTTTDIANRALQLVGTRTNITSLAENSNEAIQLNIAYAPATNWAMGLANWNFARKTVVLAQLKGPASGANWSTTMPQPPWGYEYSLPNDFLTARYLTTNAVGLTTPQNWYGEPKRFALGRSTSGTDAEILMTNENPAYLIYTSSVTDPTLWPWYFERFAVSVLAAEAVLSLTGSEAQIDKLQGLANERFAAAWAANKMEGLYPGDTTPEWEQAIGIDYPYRRMHVMESREMREKDGRNQR